MLVGAFIAVFYFLDFHDPEFAVPVGQDPEVGCSQAVAEGVTGQRLDVLAVRHGFKRFGGIAYLDLVLMVQLA